MSSLNNHSQYVKKGRLIVQDVTLPDYNLVRGRLAHEQADPALSSRVSGSTVASERRTHSVAHVSLSLESLEQCNVVI